MLTSYKGLMIVIDGLGDRGIPGFGGQTPLESAETPNMDRLADAGQCGLIDPLHPGMPVGTHTGMSLLFGLPRKQALKLARGPVEAAGIGFSHKENAIYLRCNFATLEKSGQKHKILDRRAGRVDEGFSQLATDLGELDLGEGIHASLHPATQHRVVLKLSGDHLSHRISNTDPGNHYRTQGVLTSKALDDEDSDAVRTAAAVNRLTDLIYDRFSEHPVNQHRVAQGLLPANGIICRSPGSLHNIKTTLQHFQVSTAVISGEETVFGLGNLFGFTLFRDPCFTALPDTDLQKKVATAKAALQTHDLVFLHIKGPDICSHDQDPASKRQLLSKIDDAIAPLMNESLVIGITGDHSTDSNSGRHTGDPVPGLICGPQCRIDTVHTFGESSCSSGGLTRIDSSGFLLSMLDHMNRLENLKPEDCDFFL
ncbi:MAG: 2,3-bisphosphoglycerate-independent phosphoglycerate mutase [Candidatus Thiodiazotropha sp. (ex Myrtea spinifera)]|nr:2,3-bisphosphoglycerate-independent phosphoglycerate mutase [Candidatus Thiodiazotropha sp. (ex Myrtea spinifera)]MCU7829270.1 2,3-bisphosphoglycerate-independent phosphoglycerate mutase [Candidatus Thiodiazotropha sp. (ex Myrtea sp. 'scaly one' KF741663)]